MIDYHLASFEFLGIVYYEVMLSMIMGAFSVLTDKRKYAYIILSLLPLMLMTMFRAETVGNDTLEYLMHFESISDLSLIQVLEYGRFENGYLVFTYFLRTLSHENQILLIVSGLLMYTSLAMWISKWCSAPGLFVCLLVEMLYVDSWMSIIRQSLALFIILFSFNYLVKRNFKGYILTVLLASQFHNAAFSFLLVWPIVYWINNSNTYKYSHEISEKRTLLIFSFVCLVLYILLGELLNYFISIFPIYSYYVSSDYMDGNTRIAVYLKLVIFILMIVVPILFKKKKLLDKDVVFRHALNVLTYINLVFWILANQATLLVRFTDIFSFFALANFVENINDMSIKHNRTILIIMSVAAFFIYGLTITILKTPEWQTTYPFKWCFM